MVRRNITSNNQYFQTYGWDTPGVEKSKILMILFIITIERNCRTKNDNNTFEIIVVLINYLNVK